MAAPRTCCDDDEHGRPDVFLVDANGARLLSCADQHAMVGEVIPIEDLVFATAVMFGCKHLPVEIINAILALIGPLNFCVSSNVVVPGQSEMNVRYLRLSIPTVKEMRLPHGFHVLPCRRLLVDCSSHDQGWATWEQENDDIDALSWTWSELQVTSPKRTKVPVGRVHVTTNVRADDRYRHHRRIFGPDDEVVQHVVPGSTVEMYLRSRYPGWKNYVNHGVIQASFHVEIDEEFDFQAGIGGADPSSSWRCTIQ
ncbi:TPA: hypothetical protein N0F65_009590 [Lagenidium giganteum]|uniref:Uncharacterized protein n=1 Tax=Lagenidium giganteum TaxID=4803 RepID=A0AAV2YH83_9STRA|nr:TPA: hypothetical protein N0F65_009590 [Lagenidium giganteum]